MLTLLLCIATGAVGGAGGLAACWALHQRRDQRDTAILRYLQQQGGQAPSLLLRDKEIADADDLVRLERAGKVLACESGTTYGPRGPEPGCLIRLTRYGHVLAEAAQIAEELQRRGGVLPEESL